MAMEDWNLDAAEEAGQQEELRNEEARRDAENGRIWQEIRTIADELKREQLEQMIK